MSKDELVKALFEHRRITAINADPDSDPAVVWIDPDTGDLCGWAPEIGSMRNWIPIADLVIHLVDTIQAEGGHLFITGYLD